MVTVGNVDRSKLSDMLLEYAEKKDEFPNDIVWFRVGDFYESYFEDAVSMSNICNITLTAKKIGVKYKPGEVEAESENLSESEILNSQLCIPMAGVPIRVMDIYCNKVIKSGRRVVIVEQLENPSDVKGRNIKRGVVGIRSSINLDTDYVSDYSNNFLCVVYQDSATNYIGLCFSDVSTGEIYLTTVSRFDDLLNELMRYRPNEVVLTEASYALLYPMFQTNLCFNMLVTAEDSVFNCSNLNENILSAFNITALNNIEYNSFLELYSLNVLLNYIEYTQQTSIKFNTLPVCYSLNSYMNIDLDSRINLELCENLSDNTSKRSLYDVLNYCKTSMGCRLLKQWIETPLLNRGKIERRLKGVSELCLDKSALSDAHKSLLGILDISRIIGRLKLNRITPNDFINLRSSLQKIPMLKSYMQSYSSEILNSLYNNLDNYDAITSFLEAAFMDNPAGDIKDGLVLKAGFNTELDAARDLITDSNKYINEFESNERRRTGIKKLKVVMKSGKCVIEVKNSKDNAMLIPADYELEKSLKSSTQYVNSDTRQLESSLLSATERSKQIEIELYEQIKDAVLSESNKFTILSNVIAEFDVLCSLAQAAVNNNYVCPTLNTDGVLDIQNGRHPVVEKLVKESFVDNDVYMNETTDRFLLITGPNMAGKSTYMRQIALIVLMAHMGSFIPASNANIPLTDKIFTRIGASDNIGSGRSTYMVEMVEVKNILENATRNSLVLLDEVGRGTSTLDGISIAQSLTEYIHNRIGCKTLFATHYHELIELDKTLSGLKNYHMSAFKEEDGLHFIRKIERGGITKSYGIDVAEMAGIPKEVIDRSLEILHTLEVKCGTVHYLSEEESEYSLLDVTYSSNTEQIMNTLKSFKGARLSPFECYNVLNELIDLVGDK